MNKPHKHLKRKTLIQSSMLLMSAFFLMGCDSIGDNYNTFIQDSANDLEQSSQLTQIESDSTIESEAATHADEFIDTRLVPEQSMLESALFSREDLTFGETVFSSTDRFIQKQQAFEVSVDSMQMIEVESFDNALESEFNFDEKGASLILLHATITNTSDETFYFPIDELRLSYPSATIHNYPSNALYPMESGNLADILLTNSGEMGPQTAVEGYLIYGVGGEATEGILAAESLYLTVVPPRQNLSQIVGLGSNALGEELPLYLPTTKEMAVKLLRNMTYIQDRLTTELWGEKEIIASQTFDQTETTDEGVSVTLKRIEVSDFKPNEAYEEAFQYFNYGQVLVSLEYQVTNESEFDILPVNGSASLVINGDEIKDDYILINELYGTTLKAGDSYTVIKSFALDKMSYAENWQENDFYISLSIPIDDTSVPKEVAAESLVDEDVEADEVAEIDDLGAELLSVAIPEFFFEFTWTPDLLFFVDENMELISQKDWQAQHAPEEVNDNDDENDEAEADLEELPEDE